MADIYVACPRCGFPLNINEPMRDILDTANEKILRGMCVFRLSCESCEDITLEVEIRRPEDGEYDEQQEVEVDEKMLN